MGNAVDELLSPVEVVDPRVGATLAGRYELRARIGRGGMGAVYEAQHLVIEKLVAVKILRDDLAANAEQVARFRREATAAAAIGHRNIIDVLDMGRAEDGAVFLVMERLRGQDWSDALDQSTPTVDDVVDVLSQVLDGLGAAHEAGILHRDLKPANVFVCDDGTVKLLDFGVSKVMDATALSTSTGVAMGTPVFMSPEQIRDSKNVDARADLYSVGVMLFYALTGRYPFEGHTVPELAYKIVAEPPPRLRAHRPDTSEALDALVDELLAKDPDDRPRSCALIKARLLAAVRAAPAEDLGSAATMPATPSMAPPKQEPAPTAETPPPTRSYAPWIAAAVLVLGAGVTLALTSMPDDEPTEDTPVVEAPEPQTPEDEAATEPPELPRGVDPVAAPAPTPEPETPVAETAPRPRPRPVEPEVTETEPETRTTPPEDEAETEDDPEQAPDLAPIELTP